MSATRVGAVIVDALCREKGGSVRRAVRPIVVDYYSRRYVFEKLHGLPSLFSNVPLRQPSQMEAFDDPRNHYFLVDDVGIAALTHVVPQFSACVHFTFWDRRLRGREPLGRAFCVWALNSFHLHGLWTAIPASAKPTVAFAQRIGLHIMDWRPRATVDRNGQPDDAVILGFFR